MCHLQELYAKYSDKGFVVIGCDVADDKKIALEMLRDNKVTFPNIIDSSDAAINVCFRDYQRFGRSAVPMSYVIGRDGRIVDAWYGYEEGEPRTIAAMKKVGGELAESIARENQKEAAKSSQPVIDDAIEAMKAGGEVKTGGEVAKDKPRVVPPITAASAAAVAAAARRLFDAMRDADYDRDWTTGDDWKQFPAKDVGYRPDRDSQGWVRWVCKNFKANAIADVRLGKVVAGGDGSPTVYYELHLKDGKTLKGDLPFAWDATKKQWIAQKALDWHLQKKP
jgi:hypothetical protein